MPSYNKLILMGNLTRDIDLKELPSGQTVGSFGIAVNRKYKTKEGNSGEEVSFVDCEVWGKTAEIMAQYLSRGRAVLLDGRIKMDQWEDKDGNKRSKLKMVVESFQFIDSKQEDEPQPVAVKPGNEPVDESDIPF